MHKRGYRNAIISTDFTNYRAQLFYSNFGFSHSDSTYWFCRTPDGGPPEAVTHGGALASIGPHQRLARVRCPEFL
jgi:hypothetical protein